MRRAPQALRADSAGRKAVGAVPAMPLDEGMGSIIIVVATDAPLLPHQLERVAKRASLGVGRMGGLGEDSSDNRLAGS
jgi:D-aminopeptidase